MTVWIRSRVQMPNYVKESIRSLVKSICDKDVDVSIALHKESKTDQQRKYFWTLVKELRSVMKNGQTENRCVFASFKDIRDVRFYKPSVRSGASCKSLLPDCRSTEQERVCEQGE